MTIDIKYKIPLTGKYNAGVYRRVECGVELLTGEKHGSVYNHVIGAADAYIGAVVVVECPQCFSKWYFHAGNTEVGGGAYGYFVRAIEEGENLHFKKS